MERRDPSIEKGFMLVAVLLILGLYAVFGCGCGYSSKQSEVTGQVKKISRVTPVICPDRTDVDVSLGVMRNGVGSMSTEDIWFTVPDQRDQDILKKAAESTLIVRVTYDVARLAICKREHIVTQVQVLP